MEVLEPEDSPSVSGCSPHVCPELQGIVGKISVLTKQIMEQVIITNSDQMAAAFLTTPSLLIILDEIDTLMVKLPRKVREVVVTEMLDTRFIELLADVVHYADNGKSTDSMLMETLRLIYGMFATITDCSQRACMVLMGVDLVALLIKNISKDEFRQTIDSDEVVEHFISVNMSTIHNIGKIPESQEKFDEVNAIEAIQYFFASDNSERLQVSALCSVACILNESELAKTCLDKHQLIPKLVRYLRLALESEPLKCGEHNYLGFSAEELAESIKFIAVCDKNKRTIVDNGAIPLFLKLSFSEDKKEQQRAFCCLWTLSFVEDIRKQIVATDGCIEQLEKVYNSLTEPEVRKRIRCALDYIKLGNPGLSQIGHHHRHHETSSVIINNDGNETDDSGLVVDDGDDDDYEQETTSISSSSRQSGDEARRGEGRHVFISYSWSQQPTIFRIRDLLVEQGYHVWLDVECMHGSTLEAMANAVEEACVVLLCYSENYKFSNNCRAEAEYIFNLRKKFIPLNMQFNYRPTGWLGMLLGSKLYIDFSLEVASFESSATKLLAELSNLCPLHHNSSNNLTVIDDDFVAPATSDRRLSVMMSSRASVSSGVSSMTSSSASTFSTSQSRRLFAQQTQEATIPEESPSSSLVEVLSQFSQSFLQGIMMMTTKTTQQVKLKQVKKWSLGDVHRWLQSESLQHLRKNPMFARFDGRALFSLAQMKQSAPDIYYKQVMRLFNKSLIDSLQFSTALDALMDSNDDDDKDEVVEF